MQNKQHLVLLMSICLLGFFLRFYQVANIPNSLSADETSFAYNAYSILKTGKDEFGHVYPLYFQSFDDYKNPLFGYFLIPFIYFLDLNEFAIRFPSVIIGTLVIPLFYFLTKKFTDNSKTALISALFAGISPWLIQYSRVAIDMELALLLALSGVWFFLQAVKKNVLYLLSAIFFALSFYTYHSSKVWVIFFGIVLLIINRKFNKFILMSIILFILLVLPYFRLLTNSEIGLRPYAISVFSNQEEKATDAKLLLFDKEQKIWGANLIHNRRFTFLNQAINGYLRVLNPEILFSQSSYNQIPQTRLFYLWQFPLIIFGVIVLFQNKKKFLLVISWILIGFVPGGLTSLPVYDRRIFLISFPLLFLAALGLQQLLNLVSKYNLQLSLTKLLVAVIIASSFAFYIHRYFIHGKNEVVYLWGNGMKETVMQTKKEKERFNKVFVSLRLNQTLTFFLFYEKYPPAEYLQEGGTVSGGYLREENKFDKYKFKFITRNDMANDALFVWSVDELQPCLSALHTTYITNGLPLAHIGIFDPNKKSCQQWLTEKPVTLFLPHQFSS